jgi:kynurenine formamidase
VKITDITGWIYSGMWSCCREYPGAVVTELPQPGFLNGRYRVFCQKFEIGGQTGTYIETRAHAEENAPPLSDYRASDFFFECKIIKLCKKAPFEKISLDEIKSKSPPVEKGDAVLLSAGWDERWDDGDFVSASPFISKEAGEWLIGRGIKLLGADFPRFDNPSAPEFPWGLFWENVTFLMAPVVNLSGVLGEAVRLIALPIKVRGAAAAPARAVIIE